MNDELVRFVRQALAAGHSKPEVQAKLLEAHWPADEVDKALDAYADIHFPIPVPRPQLYLSAREAFLYLALFSTLYASAVALGTLLYQFIDRAFPDPVVMTRALQQLSAIRWSTSYLIITFPIFLVLSRTMAHAIRRDPEKRTSKIRKWLTYLTLFVAAGVLLGDLVTLVFSLLSGGLTTRFLLKVATVAAIAGSVFGFYLWDLRQDDVEPEVSAARHPGMRVFTTAISVAVVAAVVGGLLLAGSPGGARRTRLDDRREVDLQTIARAIDVYWSQSQRLPEDLDQLSRERGVDVRSIHDPATSEPYEYRVTGPKTYELCALFDREDQRPEESSPNQPSDLQERFWAHGAGRACFSLEALPLGRVVLEPQSALAPEIREPNRPR